MSAEAPAAPPPAPPPRRHRLRWLWRLLAALLILLLIVAGVVFWVFSTPEGAKFVLGRVQGALGEGTRFSDVQGRIGGALRIGTIEVSRPDMYIVVKGFEIDTSPLAPFHGRLLVHKMNAESVQVYTASTEEAAKIPVTFEPPYPVKLEEGRVGELRIGALTPEARAEKDVAKRRVLVQASRDKDLVVKDILLRGEGDKRHWNIAEASARTPYGRGRLAGSLATTAPFTLDANAEASGSFNERDWSGKLQLKGTLKAIDAALDANVAGQRATAHAALQPFSKPPVRSLEVEANDVDIARFAPSAPHTRLAVEAKLGAEGQGFAGPVRIRNAEPGPWDQGHLPFQSAAARVHVVPERVDVTDLSMSLLGGGAASGRVTLQRAGANADLRVADVDLYALHHGLQKTRVTGRVAVEATGEAQRFDVALKDPRFDITGRAAIANQRLDVETVRIQTGGGAVDAKGRMQLAGSREFRFEGEARHFDPAAFVRTTAGDLNFRFVAAGTLADSPAGRLEAEILPSRYAGLPASGRISVAGDANRLASSNVHLLIGDGRLDATGSFGRPGDALDVALNAPNLSAIGSALGMTLAGRIDAKARVTGTFKAPAGRIELTGANLALPSNVFVQDLALKGEAGSDPASRIDVALQAKGVAVGKDKPPQTVAETATLALRGTRADHRIDLEADMTRQSHVKLAMQGGLDPRSTAPAWNGRIETLALTGPGAFALQSPATVQASAARVELGPATLRGDWGEANLVVTRWTPRTLELKGSSQAIQIQTLARSLKLGDVPRSTLVVAADWNIRAAENFEGTANLRRVSGDLRLGEPPLPLGLTDLELRLDATRGRAHATVRIVGQRVGRIEGDARAVLERGTTGWQLAKSQPLDAHLTADVPDLSTVAAWLGPDAKLAGRMNANVVVSGSAGDPRVSGEVRAQNLSLREPQSGFEVDRGDIALKVAGKSVTVERFEASTPWNVPVRALRKFGDMKRPERGRITADGGLDLETRTGTLRIRLDQAVVTQTSSRFLAISGEAQLQATKEGVLAMGNLKADAGYIGALSSSMPSISEDVVVVRKTAPAPAAPTAKEKEKLALDVRFDLGNRLFFEGRGLDTRLAGNLHVTGVPTALKAEGAIRTVGGSYNGYGQKLSIERGALAFTGPIDNPQLNVRAMRKGLPVEAGVEVTGSVVHPKVRLVSVPDVPDPEKLSWMVLGRGPSELGPGDASVLVAAAASMLGKGDGTGIQEKLGLDEVKIGRADTQSILGVLPQSTVAGRTGTASAAEVISIGKKITKNVHLTLEQGLADAEGALRITVNLSRTFQLMVRAGYLPGIDLVRRWSFD